MAMGQQPTMKKQHVTKQLDHRHILNNYFPFCIIKNILNVQKVIKIRKYIYINISKNIACSFTYVDKRRKNPITKLNINVH